MVDGIGVGYFGCAQLASSGLLIVWSLSEAEVTILGALPATLYIFSSRFGFAQRPGKDSTILLHLSTRVPLGSIVSR